jgi:hypothetical protein
MASRLLLAVVGASSISVLGVSSGEAVMCDPHCAPSKSNTFSQSNKGPEVRGTDHAMDVANQNGVENGLSIAREQPGKYKTPVPVVSGGGDAGGTTGGTTGGTSGGTTTGPCTGC